MSNLEFRNIEIHHVKIKENEELSQIFFRNCVFCEKVVKVSPNNVSSCSNLSGNYFYCPFCLRHNHHHNNSKNILIMSFRAIVGHYYNHLYVDRKLMYLSEIHNMVDKHAHLGLSNPVLNYDPVSMLWFADFNKIGDTAKKAPYKEVIDLCKAMLDVFDVSINNGTYVENDFWLKIDKAMSLFYRQRKRPKDRKMLIPTLITSVPQSSEAIESSRKFMFTDLRVV